MPPISASRSRAAAQRRVGGDAGERIRAAAVQTQHDPGSGRFDAPLGGGASRSSARSSRRAASTVARVPPLDCSVMPSQAPARAPSPGNARSGCPRSPGPGSPRPRRWDAPARRRACAAVGRCPVRSNAPQPSPCGNATTPSTLGGSVSPAIAAGDQLGGVGGAVAGRHHGDVVARADAAVLARVAEEGGTSAQRAGGAGSPQLGNSYSGGTPRRPELWVCTCSPGLDRRCARPIAWP